MPRTQTSKMRAREPDQLTTFTGYAALYARIANEYERGRYSTLKHYDVQRRRRKSSRSEIVESLQECFSNLGMRGHEVFDLRINSQHRVDSDRNVCVDDVKIIVAEDPVAATERVENPTKLFFRNEDSLGNIDIPEDAPARAVVEHTIGKFRSADSKASTHDLILDHLSGFVGLLRRVHRANKKEQYLIALEQLNAYVFTVGNKKMILRLEEGTEKNSYFDTIVTGIKTKEQESRRFWYADDISSASFLTQAPSRAQLQFMQGFFNAQDMPEQAECAASEALYGPRGRWRFHRMLVFHLKAVKSSLAKLRKATTFWEDHTQTVPDSPEETSRICKLALNAHEDLYNFSTLLLRFDREESAIDTSEMDSKGLWQGERLGMQDQNMEPAAQSSHDKSHWSDSTQSYKQESISKTPLKARA